MNLKGKKVTVIGLAKSGFAAATLLKRQGAKARVTEVSAKDSVACLANQLEAIGIDVEVGRHTEKFLEGAELVVTSPGVPDAALPLEWARKKNINVIDETEIAYRFCKAPIIAITGTNGKSTTTALIGHILNKSGKKAIVCGNIGAPFSGEVDKLEKDSICVLEISSFQLSRIDKFRPRVAVLLNVTQNHLDRHSDFNEYLNAKMNIFRNQTSADWAILNCRDANILKNIKAKKIFFNKKGVRSLFEAGDLQIKGAHNVENALAAAAAVRIFGVPADEIKEAVRTFRGLEHRCEYVATINGIKFINDSKSTTVDAAVKALSCCDGPVVMIAGGRDKNSDFTPLRRYIKDKVRLLILIGEAKDKIKNALAGSVDMKESSSLEDATSLAFDNAKKGDTVLFSPMCTSFDSFQDFEHRGRVFKECVMQG